MVVCRKNSLLLLLLSLLSFEASAVGPHTDHDVPVLMPEDQERLVNYANMFEGSPYSFGARRPSSEDCSSFIQKIFSSVGVELPRSSREQATDPRFVDVSRDELRPGDLVFFRNTYRRGISHVAFMVDPQTMIHASPRDKQVAKASLTPRHPLWKKIHSVRRWKHTKEGDGPKPRFSWEDQI
jgi:cell wall-associated NlpC family hydrolase